MPPANTPKPRRYACPNCATPFLSTDAECSKCHLQVAQMKSFIAAKRAAEAKGITTTEIQSSTSRPLPSNDSTPKVTIDPSVKKYAGALFVLVVIAVGYYLYSHRYRPPAYLAYPTSRDEVAKQLLAHIATGDDAQYAKAYALVAPSARDARDSDEEGHYYGLYHAIYKYLTGEFGDGWDKTATLAQDPNDPNVTLATVGLETLHIRTAQQTPQEKIATDNQHFALIGIDEFDINDAGSYQQMEGVVGFLGGEAGQGAVNNLKTVLGASGHLHQSPMQLKVALLPIARNPRQVSRQSLIRLWPVRKDPVVRNRLTQISTDARYEDLIQKTAADILKDNISDEELIAVGVQ